MNDILVPAGSQAAVPIPRRVALFSRLRGVYTHAACRTTSSAGRRPGRGREAHMATAPSPNDLTRQQLDELDALLQRMLSLPLNPPDTPSPVTPTAKAPEPPPVLPNPGPNWRVDPPAAPAPHMLLAVNPLP